VAFDGVDRHGQVGGDLVEGEHGREQSEDGEFAFAQGGVSGFAAGAGGECSLGEGLGGSEAAELVDEEFADAGPAWVKGRRASSGSARASAVAGRGGRRGVRRRPWRGRFPVARRRPGCGEQRGCVASSTGRRTVRAWSWRPPADSAQARMMSSSALWWGAFGEPAVDGAGCGGVSRVVVRRGTRGRRRRRLFGADGVVAESSGLVVVRRVRSPGVLGRRWRRRGWPAGRTQGWGQQAGVVRQALRRRGAGPRVGRRAAARRGRSSWWRRRPGRARPAVSGGAASASVLRASIVRTSPRGAGDDAEQHQALHGQVVEAVPPAQVQRGLDLGVASARSSRSSSAVPRARRVSASRCGSADSSSTCGQHDRGRATAVSKRPTARPIARRTTRSTVSWFGQCICACAGRPGPRTGRRPRAGSGRRSGPARVGCGGVGAEAGERAA
jgi:hypothetical protein